MKKYITAALLFCAALTFYLWVAVPRVQAQDLLLAQ